MKVQTNTTNSVQTDLLGIKKGILNPIRAAKLKNRANTSKLNTKQKINRALFSNENEKENFSPEKPKSGILQASKKIQKQSKKSEQSKTSRKVLGDITNKFHDQSSEKDSEKDLPKEEKGKKAFKEDEVTQTSNYITLNYINLHSRKRYQFFCFHDTDLKIPAEHAIQTIPHSCDNDCTTDEDQIRSAIKNTYRAIENHLKQQKEIDLYLKKP